MTVQTVRYLRHNWGVALALGAMLLLGLVQLAIIWNMP
jgi:hypothetical protein